jgi:ribonucleoside-diphosphate reductase beta chain
MSLTSPSLVYKPFAYPWAVEYAVQSEKAHWGEWEAKLQDDVAQWQNGKLTAKEKNHITQILRLFTQSDVAVGTNYLEYYVSKFKNNEVRAMLTSFVNREFVHQRSYALLNDTLGLPESEYSAFLEYKQMKEKIEFMSDIDVTTQTGVAKAIARSVMNEGMSLFSAFAMLLNYQRFGKMKGMCEIVEWSVRDETLHCEGMVALFREFCKEHPKIVTDEFKKDIYQMFRDGVALEDAVVDAAFELGDIEGLTAEEVKRYIRYIADRRLIQLGLKGNWKVKDNPLDWLDWIIGGDNLKNFFEGVVTDYSSAGMEGDWGWNETTEHKLAA